MVWVLHDHLTIYYYHYVNSTLCFIVFFLMGLSLINHGFTTIRTKVDMVSFLQQCNNDQFIIFTE